MKRLIVAMLVAGILLGTIWALNATLPLTGGTEESSANSNGNSWDGDGGWGGMSLMGAP